MGTIQKAIDNNLSEFNQGPLLEISGHPTLDGQWYNSGRAGHKGGPVQTWPVPRSLSRELSLKVVSNTSRPLFDAIHWAMFCGKKKHIEYKFEKPNVPFPIRLVSINLFPKPVRIPDEPGALELMTRITDEFHSNLEITRRNPEPRDDPAVLYPRDTSLGSLNRALLSPEMRAPKRVGVWYPMRDPHILRYTEEERNAIRSIPRFSPGEVKYAINRRVWQRCEEERQTFLVRVLWRGCTDPEL